MLIYQKLCIFLPVEITITAGMYHCTVTAVPVIPLEAAVSVYQNNNSTVKYIIFKSEGVICYLLFAFLRW